MYKLKDIQKEELSTITIKNQKEIIARTGSKLDPIAAYELIQKETDNFKTPNAIAEKADALLYALLMRGEKQEKEPPKKTTPKKEKPEPIEHTTQKMRIREGERKRALVLLKLKLELEIPQTN